MALPALPRIASELRPVEGDPRASFYKRVIRRERELRFLGNLVELHADLIASPSSLDVDAPGPSPTQDIRRCPQTFERIAELAAAWTHVIGYLRDTHQIVQ